MLKTQEHIDLIAQFEKDAGKLLALSLRFEKEVRALWIAGRIYCHGETNTIFLAYRLGYAFGKCIERTAEVA